MFSISKKVLYPAAVVLIVISLFAAFQAQSDQANPAPEVASSSKSDQTTSAPDLSPGQSSAQAASAFEVSVGPSPPAMLWAVPAHVPGGGRPAVLPRDRRIHP